MATGRNAFEEKKANSMNLAEYRQRNREATTDSDLATARKAGKSYKQFYKDSAARDKAAGILNEEAAAAGRAYELDSPEEVEAREANKRAGAGRGSKNPPAVKSEGVKEMLQEVQDAKDRKKVSDMGYAKGGSVRGWGAARGGKKAKIC